MFRLFSLSHHQSTSSEYELVQGQKTQTFMQRALIP